MRAVGDARRGVRRSWLTCGGALAAGWLALASGARAQVPAVNLVAGDTQSNGPGYGFHIGVTEVTNQQFVDFLNNALANPANERGHYLFFATDTGSVSG